MSGGQDSQFSSTQKRILGGGVGAIILIVLAIVAWKDKSIDIPLISEGHSAARGSTASGRSSPTDVEGCVAAWNRQSTEDKAKSTIFSVQRGNLEAWVSIYDGPQVTTNWGYLRVVTGDCLVTLPGQEITLAYSSQIGDWQIAAQGGRGSLYEYGLNSQAANRAEIVKEGSLRLASQDGSGSTAGAVSLSHLPQSPEEVAQLIKPYVEQWVSKHGTSLGDLSCGSGYPGFRPLGVPNNQVFACVILMVNGGTAVKQFSFDSGGRIIDEENVPSNEASATPSGSGSYSPQCDPSDPRYHPAYC